MGVGLSVQVAQIVSSKRLNELEDAARVRTFGVDDEEKRASILHGYLLALEEVVRPCRG
jgi:hypothetical protein